MASIMRQAAEKAVALLQSDDGLAAAIAAISADVPDTVKVEAAQVVALNVAPELAERTAGAKYPVIHVYCERVKNDLKEKFRTFSGTVRVVAEVRVSQDRIDNIEAATRVYSDALIQLLDSHRGDWGDGMFFAGVYEVAAGAVRRGGKNFAQTAKITFDLEVSR